MFFGKVVVKLPNPSEVGFDGSFAGAFQVDKTGVILIWFG